MCGVLAIVTPGQKMSADLLKVARRMNSVMERRGPDGHGILARNDVLLGHRRLAIRGGSAGRQPMATPDGRYAISYNGELYNDDELRRTLTADHGVTFETRCDTETLLHAFRVWGKQCVDHLRGMFALVAVDFHSGEVLIARDRCGVKPLFYTHIGTTLLVASSIAALLEHPDVPRRPNYKAISHYLSSFRLTLGRETMYEGIYQLESAQRMTVNSRGTQIETYWELPVEDQTINFAEAVASLETGLDDAVKRRQVSDRPVGMLLSGGIDSASIASVMSQSGGSFFACGAGQEVETASQTAETVGCEFESVRSSEEDYDQAWSELLRASRLPASTPSDPVILLIAKQLKQKVDVALGGEGADEMLCGYAAQHWTGEDFVRHAMMGSSGTTPFRLKLAQRYGRDSFRSPVDLFIAGNSFLQRELKPHVFKPEVWDAAEHDEPIDATYEAAAGTHEDESASRKIYRLIHRVNLEGQLSRLDTATMQASLEGRVPFTDHVLCEQMAEVSFQNHIRIYDGCDPDQTSNELADSQSLHTKRLLREVAGQRLPEAIINRPKQSFPTPVFQWLSGPWTNRVKQTLATSPFLSELIHPELLPQLVESPETAGLLLWPLMNLAHWGDQEFAA
ncbi:Asparagine synthetase [glutamine-hydrolyzing] 3 [Rubripirellula obstinata]|uniref:asparagine synthase (glutamine-hydrolyzing) n=1 Tax=Rubripirellula obstinata TaxID=406547 RepID=A0A5B1CHF2_9BACT|nr:asparagine synthase (glutamine-hydrolyzing) [Rubripirellula obstinata]KAA1259365.1 Asparagine synthetase [glutamine-hydrolyzing] 3 [Rubripirellula obstinata]